jgi:hypothetical protein
MPSNVLTCSTVSAGTTKSPSSGSIGGYAPGSGRRNPVLADYPRRARRRLTSRHLADRRWKLAGLKLAHPLLGLVERVVQRSRERVACDIHDVSHTTIVLEARIGPPGHRREAQDVRDDPGAVANGGPVTEYAIGYGE